MELTISASLLKGLLGNALVSPELKHIRLTAIGGSLKVWSAITTMQLEMVCDASNPPKTTTKRKRNTEPTLKIIKEGRAIVPLSLIYGIVKKAKPDSLVRLWTGSLSKTTKRQETGKPALKVSLGASRYEIPLSEESALLVDRSWDTEGVANFDLTPSLRVIQKLKFAAGSKDPSIHIEGGELSTKTDMSFCIEKAELPDIEITLPLAALTRANDLGGNCTAYIHEGNVALVSDSWVLYTSKISGKWPNYQVLMENQPIIAEIVVDRAKLLEGLETVSPIPHRVVDLQFGEDTLILRVEDVGNAIATTEVEAQLPNTELDEIRLVSDDLRRAIQSEDTEQVILGYTGQNSFRVVGARTSLLGVAIAPKK